MFECAPGVDRCAAASRQRQRFLSPPPGAAPRCGRERSVQQASPVDLWHVRSSRHHVRRPEGRERRSQPGIWSERKQCRPWQTSGKGPPLTGTESGRLPPAFAGSQFLPWAVRAQTACCPTGICASRGPRGQRTFGRAALTVAAHRPVPSSPRAVKPWRIRRTTRSHEPQRRKHMQRHACTFGRSSARPGAGTAAPILLAS